MMGYHPTQKVTHVLWLHPLTGAYVRMHSQQFPTRHVTGAGFPLTSTTLSSHIIAGQGTLRAGTMCSWLLSSSFQNADARQGMQEEEEQQAAPPVKSLEAVVEEQAAAEGAARQARVCFFHMLTPDIQGN